MKTQAFAVFRKGFLLVLFYLLFHHHVAAQKQGKNRIDSLLTLVSKKHHDTTLIKIYSDLSSTFLGINDDSSLFFANKLYALALKLNDKRNMGLAYMFQGVYYNTMFDFIKAQSNFEKAGNLFKSIKSERDMARLLNNLGNYYNSRGDIKKSFESYSNAIKLYKKYDMKTPAAVSLGNIGRIYQSWGKPDSALICFEAAYNVFKEMNDSSGIARMLGNSGNIYDIKGQFAEAMRRKFAALEIYSKLNNAVGLGRTYNNLAYSYLHAIGAITTPGTPDSLKNRNQLLNKAKKYIDIAISINQKYHYHGVLVNDYQLLTDIEYEMGDFKSALLTYNRFIHLKDSVFSIENERKMNAIEVRRAEEVKQKEIELKNYQIKNIKKERWYYVFGFLFVLIIVFLLIRGIKRQQKANHLLLAEKQKSEALLLNILPPEVADELKENGYTTAKKFPQVTVLFSDIVNFTQISETLGAELLVKELDTYFSAFDGIMAETGLEKIKTIGDAYIAANGLNSEARNDDAVKVIHTACVMQKKVADLKHERELKGRPWFEFRIGIHTGPVVAGVVGVKKFQYDIWGDTVNTAARMESSSEAGKINISGVTYELVKSDYECIYRGKIEAKHKEPIDMYFVKCD